jgi:preprotein translocase subunit SecY
MRPEFARRIAFTLGALLVFRIGAYIPLPGTDAAAWGRATGYHSHDFLFGLVDLPSGGSARHFAIFALGIIPYFTAALLIQLAAMGSQRLRALVASGDRGRGKVAAYTLYLTIALTAFQAFGVSHGLESLPGLVAQPGPLFELTTVLSLTAGTMLLVWLCNQITARGVGNGLVLILAVGLLVDLPANLAVAVIRAREGYMSTDAVVAAAILGFIFTVFIVVVEGARRHIAIDYPQNKSARLALKLNSAGLIPTILGSWFIFVPAAALTVALGPTSGGGVFHYVQHGRPLFMIFYAILIVVFTLFYTAFLIDPEKASETLKKFGATVRGIAPGEATAGHIDYVLSRITVVGALYLAVVFIVPELLIVYFGVPFYLGGAAYLIIVCAVMDLAAQVRQDVQLSVGSYPR